MYWSENRMMLIYRSDEVNAEPWCDKFTII
jgi:hypothetical protein